MSANEQHNGFDRCWATVVEHYQITVREDEDHGAESLWWRLAERLDASSISSTSSRLTIPCATGGEDELVGQLCQVSRILVEGKGMVWVIKLEVMVATVEIHLINPYLRIWWDRTVAEILQHNKDMVVLRMVVTLVVVLLAPIADGLMQIVWQGFR